MSHVKCHLSSLCSVSTRIATFWSVCSSVAYHVHSTISSWVQARMIVVSCWIPAPIKHVLMGLVQLAFCFKSQVTWKQTSRKLWEDKDLSQEGRKASYPIAFWEDPMNFWGRQLHILSLIPPLHFCTLTGKKKKNPQKLKKQNKTKKQLKKTILWY